MFVWSFLRFITAFDAQYKTVILISLTYTLLVIMALVLDAGFKPILDN